MSKEDNDSGLVFGQLEFAVGVLAGVLAYLGDRRNLPRWRCFEGGDLLPEVVF